MDFFDNVVNKSNALIKERLNNPFGSKQGSMNASRDGSNEPETSAGGGGSASQDATSTSMPATSSNNDTPVGSTSQQEDPNNQQSSPSDDIKNGDKNSQFAAMAADAELVAQKAAKGAKNIGTFLFSMANKAGQHVTQTAKQVRQVVENTSILTDLTREQQEFVREHGGSMQAGPLPWDLGDDETKSADMREQILSLSQDKRNFVRSPPNDANFEFEPQKCYPIALSLLKEDTNLGKIRSELVPKLVNEETFWRNYFYRVSLLRQMSEKGENIKKGWTSSRSSSGEGPDEITETTEPFSPSYATAGKTMAPEKQQSIDKPQQQQQPPQAQQSFNLSNINTTTAPATDISPSFSDDYQKQELESSESRKLVAEADDLKSKLRELNIGSLDDGQDG